MSTVDPGAFLMTSDRYLPSPSWVMPRCTGTPRLGTSANFTVLFCPLKMASETSFPTFSRSMSNAADISMSEMW
jgi:hypothetical protein